MVGLLKAYEVLSAFFLKEGFLGIMLFGRKRVGEKPRQPQRRTSCTRCSLKLFAGA